MTKILLVALGGALGAVGRYLLSGAVQSEEGSFPWGTVLVNVLGCLLLGILLRFVDKGSAMHVWLAVGILGAFTTFSTFGWESLQLLQNGRIGALLGYVSANLIAGIGAVALGWWVGRYFAG